MLRLPRPPASSSVLPVVVLAVALGVLGGSGCPEGLFPLPPPGDVDVRVDVVALAGPDLDVLEGSRVVLSGRSSRGLSGDPLLAWTQVDGPPVPLTNPSSPLPAFIAPLAPAVLVFELRAEADGAVATDRVTVTVDDRPGETPSFLTVPPDDVAAPGSAVSFDVGVVGASAPVTITAFASCAGGATTTVTGRRVDVTLPQELPCIVVVDGVDAAGHGVAPAARILWPEGTPLPAPTEIQAAPRIVDPGATVSVSFASDDTGSVARAWAAGFDDVVPGGVDGDLFAFPAPRHRTRLVIGGERRQGGVSGGVRYAIVDVTAGAGNLAPVASGGSDRIVQPGARFRLDTSGSFDLDDDELQVLVTQVLGAPAASDEAAPGAFIAPDEPGELLFHVVADDGTVQSAPDAVRVLVSAEAEDQPPVLLLPATRYVIPGQRFIVDGRAAEDPDSGFIAGVTIRQADTDAFILLDEPVNAPFVELVAGAAGESYHFSISAFDEDGLVVTADQEVLVEDAGPYVDPVRGSDEGNGTAAAPFATVEGALATALRHELPELLLVEGEHPAPTVPLPARLSLRGGLRFDGAAGYVDGGGETVLPILAPGLVVQDAHLATLTVRLAGGALTLAGAASLDGVTVTEDEGHEGSLLAVQTGAAAKAVDCVVSPRATSGAAAPATIVLDPDSTLDLIDTAVEGAAVGAAVGVSCDGATLSLEGATLTGSTSGASSGVAVAAENGCTVDAIGSTITGGATDTATGILATDTLLTLDASTTVIGSVSATPARAVALDVHGRERAALIRAHVVAAPAASASGDVAGLVVDDAQVSLEGAVVESGPIGDAVRIVSGDLTSLDSTIDGASGGVVADVAGLVILEGGSVAGRTGVDVAQATTLSLTGVTVSAADTGVSAPSTLLILERSTVAVTSTIVAVGLDVAGAALTDSTVDVSAPDARGVVLGAEQSRVTRSLVHATGSAAAFGVDSEGPLVLESAAVVVVGGAGPALNAQADITLVHATLRAAGAALVAAGTIDVVNSALDGAPGLSVPTPAGAQPWVRAVGVAFDDDGPLVAFGGESVTTEGRLLELGCDLCFAADLAPLVDDTGHLAAGANALVDAADNTFATPDIDGDARPQGARADIGADERAP
jgi:hypothetical protein